MKTLFISYNKVDSFDDPQQWLERIKAYNGVLESLSNQHTVISIEQINFHGDLLKNGVQYYFFNSGKRKFFHTWHLHRFVKKLKPDLIIVHGTHFPLQVVQLKKTIGDIVKILVQNHAEKPFNWPRSYLQKLADKYINAYIFTSVEMGEEWVKKGLIADKKKIWGIMEASSVFNCFSKELSKQQTGVRGNFVFLWVGRLDKNKDPLTVIKAFLQFTKYNPEARLYMIYHTAELLNEVFKLIAEEALNKCIVLIGKVPHDKMLYWYNSADFIVSGSHYEGSGVAVCEAMSCGCIPIVTNILAFKKMTANGECGMLYNAGDESALLNALLKTGKMNIAEEQKKVLKQFDTDLSFKAIAKQIDKNISLLLNPIDQDMR